jgi:hypothetical protein
MRWYKSSGRAVARPLMRRMRRILLPVTDTTCGMPHESRRRTPICDGVMPFLAHFTISSTTASGWILHQDGGVRR